MKLWVWSAVMSLALVAGCERQEPVATGGGQAPGRIQLALNWKPEPQFGGFYAADVGGEFADRGLDVEVLQGGSGTPTVQMVGAGTVPYGIVSGDELIRARAQGNDVVALFAVYQTNPQGLMTHGSRGFDDIGDIFTSGGKLAIQRGLPYADFLENKYGFNKVTVVPNSAGVPVWMNDPEMTLQCFVTSEPLQVRQLGAEPKTFLVADAGYNPYTTVLVTRGEYLKQNPEQVKQVVDAVRAGWESYLADPAAANEHMRALNPTMDAQTFAASAEAQKTLIQTEETAQNGLGTMTAERWQTLGQQLVDLGVVENAPPAGECFVNP